MILYALVVTRSTVGSLKQTSDGELAIRASVLQQ